MTRARSNEKRREIEGKARQLTLPAIHLRQIKSRQLPNAFAHGKIGCGWVYIIEYVRRWPASSSTVALRKVDCGCVRVFSFNLSLYNFTAVHSGADNGMLICLSDCHYGWPNKMQDRKQEIPTGFYPHNTHIVHHVGMRANAWRRWHSEWWSGAPTSGNTPMTGRIPVNTLVNVNQCGKIDKDIQMPLEDMSLSLTFSFLLFFPLFIVNWLCICTFPWHGQMDVYHHGM